MSQLFAAIENDSDKLVALAIANHRELKDVRDDEGNSILARAVVAGSVKSAKLLFERYPDLCTAENNAGELPLNQAIKYTPLGYYQTEEARSLKNRRSKIAFMLIDGPLECLSHSNHEKEISEPIFSSIYEHVPAIAAKLVERLPSLLDATDEKGRTPLKLCEESTLLKEMIPFVEKTHAAKVLRQQTVKGFSKQDLERL
ncbi:hypothetical protein [Rhodopirellula bahusiensis]